MKFLQKKLVKGLVGSELVLFQHAVHWKRYFSRQIAPFLGGDVLEVGAGFGATTSVLWHDRVDRWVCLEPDGTLFIRGRRNELILRGGANVYPAEIERVIQEDERVAACAVLGAADERLGERVVAAVQRVPGAQISAEELRSRVGKQLARYKVPEQIEFVEALPRNAMSKVIKRELATLFEGSRKRVRVSD